MVNFTFNEWYNKEFGISFAALCQAAKRWH